MLLPDVNVYVNAFRADAADHGRDSSWLASALGGDETVGVSELVLSSFVRIVTNHRIFVQPSRTDAALAFCDAVLAAPAALAVRPSASHWRRFDQLCRSVDARANVVPDAYLAALALENSATLMTSDAGFGRFRGLSAVRPAITPS